ncbi:MAG: MarR family transcriptional regulator [Lachnospiraceae bacterium]|nr:MarR family transcriptional regulator [Lachnospiraceae bacterium]
MQQKVSIEFAHNLFQSYRIRCNSFCHEMQIPPTAFDILMFLANNPAYNTAKDIVELRGLKANLVSVNVDRLVREGYLDRQSFPGDRRKTILTCTPKAGPIIDQGRRLQAAFFEDIFKDVDGESRENFYRVIRMMETNLNRIIKGGV